jgi:hypothetical protein
MKFFACFNYYVMRDKFFWWKRGKVVGNFHHHETSEHFIVRCSDNEEVAAPKLGSKCRQISHRIFKFTAKISSSSSGRDYE